MQTVTAENRTDGEVSLIEGSRKGDLAAFNRLVDRHQQPVYTLAWYMSGSVPEAEDITRQTFATAWQTIGGSPQAGFGRWLMGIASDACLGRDLERRSGFSVSLQDPLHWLEEALLSLSPQERLVLILADVQRLSYEEIAAITHIPLTGVSSLLSAARRSVRDLIEAASSPPHSQTERRSYPHDEKTSLDCRNRDPADSTCPDTDGRLRQR